MCMGMRVRADGPQDAASGHDTNQHKRGEASEQQTCLKIAEAC